MRIITDYAAFVPALKKLGWFFGLWVGGVVTVAAVAGALRLALHAW